MYNICLVTYSAIIFKIMFQQNKKAARKQYIKQKEFNNLPVGLPERRDQIENDLYQTLITLHASKIMKEKTEGMHKRVEQLPK